MDFVDGYHDNGLIGFYKWKPLKVIEMTGITIHGDRGTKFQVKIGGKVLLSGVVEYSDGGQYFSVQRMWSGHELHVKITKKKDDSLIKRPEVHWR